MDSTILDLVRTVASSFQASMQERVSASGMGLTAFQARMLNLIARNQGLSQNRLGDLLARDKAQIARSVKALEAGGLVSRSLDSDNWRAKRLVLTAAGQRAHVALLALRAQLGAEALAGLSDTHKPAFEANLRLMATALQDIGTQEQKQTQEF